MLSDSKPARPLKNEAGHGQLLYPAERIGNACNTYVRATLALVGGFITTDATLSAIPRNQLRFQRYCWKRGGLGLPTKKEEPLCRKRNVSRRPSGYTREGYCYIGVSGFMGSDVQVYASI